MGVLIRTLCYSDIATDGFVAYDHQTQAEVLVMTTVLCHLGDSPMHAEVTNTMNPTVSLSPCRVCDLKVETLLKKRSAAYVSNFVGVDEHGHKVGLFCHLKNSPTLLISVTLLNDSCVCLCGAGQQLRKVLTTSGNWHNAQGQSAHLTLSQDGWVFETPLMQHLLSVCRTGFVVRNTQKTRWPRCVTS